MNRYLDIAQEVREALYSNRPVVALESNMLSHGMGYPQNVETAMNVEQIIRDNGAIPAMTAIIDGRLKCGLSTEEIMYFGEMGTKIRKCSRKDIPVVISKKSHGTTTVATTMIVAKMAEVKIFVASGIGGVHRGVERTMDISADLDELGQTPVMVICSGLKGILDIGRTLEYLETKGVPVIGYGTDQLPAFYTRKSGFDVDYRLDTPLELAAAFQAQRGAGLQTGMLVTNPIPEEMSMEADQLNEIMDRALAKAEENNIHGTETTAFLMEKIAEMTGSASLDANIQLIYNNAKLAAQTAVELCGLY